MTDSRNKLASWLQPIDVLIGTSGGKGGFFVAFPEYRPDLIQTMADALGFMFFDFRAEILLPLGWEAGQVPLSTLTDEIVNRSHSGGVVVHNAEALLATKPQVERQKWLDAFLASDWPQPVIIPIAIYQADLPTGVARFHRVDPDALPEETLLHRLATR